MCTRTALVCLRVEVCTYFLLSSEWLPEPSVSPTWTPSALASTWTHGGSRPGHTQSPLFGRELQPSGTAHGGSICPPSRIPQHLAVRQTHCLAIGSTLTVQPGMTFRRAGGPKPRAEREEKVALRQCGLQLPRHTGRCYGLQHYWQRPTVGLITHQC